MSNTKGKIIKFLNRIFQSSNSIKLTNLTHENYKEYKKTYDTLFKILSKSNDLDSLYVIGDLATTIRDNKDISNNNERINIMCDENERKKLVDFLTKSGYFYCYKDGTKINKRYWHNIKNGWCLADVDNSLLKCTKKNLLDISLSTYKISDDYVDMNFHEYDEKNKCAVEKRARYPLELFKLLYDSNSFDYKGYNVKTMSKEYVFITNKEKSNQNNNLLYIEKMLDKDSVNKIKRIVELFDDINTEYTLFDKQGKMIKSGELSFKNRLEKYLAIECKKDRNRTAKAFVVDYINSEEWKKIKKMHPIAENIIKKWALEQDENFRQLGESLCKDVSIPGYSNNISATLKNLNDDEGIKLLNASSDMNEFANEYLKRYACRILNATLEEVDKFIIDNIDFIDETTKLTYDKANKIDFTRLIKFYKGETLEIYNNDNEKKYFSKDDTLSLVKKFLLEVDSSENLLKTFNESIKEKNIILYDKKGKDVNWYLSALGPHYNEDTNKVFIPLEYNINDVGCIIHEFMHQYMLHYNKNPRLIWNEVVSIYFEKMAGEYLINNGYSEYKKEIEQNFQYREEINAFNNSYTFSNFIDMVKCKKKNKVLSSENILSSDDVQKKHEFDSMLVQCGVLSEIPKDIKDYKEQYAIRFLKQILTNEKSWYEKNVSYSLGTYYADRYSTNRKMKDLMLEIACDNKITDREIMDKLNVCSVEKNHGISAKEIVDNNAEMRVNDIILQCSLLKEVVQHQEEIER